MKHQLCKICGEPRLERSTSRTDKASAPAVVKANGADSPAEDAAAVLARRRERDRLRVARWREAKAGKAKSRNVTT